MVLSAADADNQYSHSINGVPMLYAALKGTLWCLKFEQSMDGFKSLDSEN